MRFIAAALCLLAIAEGTLEAAGESTWVGAQVMLKVTAQPQLGNQRMAWNTVPLPATVEHEDGEWLWLGAVWVRKPDALRIEDAPAYYTQLLPRVGDGKAVVYALRGVRWLARGEYVNAGRDFDEAIRLEPANSTYFSCRGKSRFQLHKYDDALADFTEAIRLDPANLVAYNDRGATLNAQSQYERAHEELSEVLRVDPNNALAYNNRGANWCDRDELDKAMDDLNAAIKLDPKMGGAYANRGRLYMRKGDYPAAIADFDRAIKIAPREWSSYNGWARVLATSPWPQLRDGKRAKELAERSCELSHWHEWKPIATLAAACAELGQFEQALKWQNKAMAMSQPAKDNEQRENDRRLECFKRGEAYTEALPAEPAVEASPAEPAVEALPAEPAVEALPAEPAVGPTP